MHCGLCFVVLMFQTMSRREQHSGLETVAEGSFDRQLLPKPSFLLPRYPRNRAETHFARTKYQSEQALSSSITLSGD